MISRMFFKKESAEVGGWEAEEFLWESVRYGDPRQGGRDLVTWNTCLECMNIGSVLYRL